MCIRDSSKSVCVSACANKNPNVRCWFLKRRLTNTPRRHRLADGQLSSLYHPHQISARLEPPLWCCAVPLLLPVRAYPHGRLCLARVSVFYIYLVMCIQTLCDHLNTLYIFDQTFLYHFAVRLELYGANARLVVSPASLSPFHPPTPPPCRSPALST